MGDILSFLAPLLYTPRNYGQVLNKLAGFALYQVYLITLLLRNVPQIDDAFRSVETCGTLGKLLGAVPQSDVLNLFGLMIAILAALLSHASRLHDRISDLLRIRRQFDVNHILLPLAEGVKSKADKEKVSANRDKLMRAVFYRYASSRDEQPLVDKHDIEHALTAWTSLWTCVEGFVWWAMGAFVALIFGAWSLFIAFAIIAAVLLALGVARHASLKRFAAPQIDAIVRNCDAAKSIKGEFDAL